MILRWMFWILGWAAAVNLDALCISGDCIQGVGTMLWQGEISQYSGSWRKGKIIAIVTEGNSGLNDLADHIIEVPETEESLSPLINTIPLGGVPVLHHFEWSNI